MAKHHIAEGLLLSSWITVVN